MQEQSEFAGQLAGYRWPSPFLRDYLAAPTPRPRDKTIVLCGLICNDKDGVPCAPKVGKKENHLVFVGRDGVDWLVEHLALTERESQCVAIMQEMCDLELVVPWQTEKKEKKSGVKYEDSDRFYWFDYAAIIRLKNGGVLESSRNSTSKESARAPIQQQPPSSADDREMHKVLRCLFCVFVCLLKPRIRRWWVCSWTSLPRPACWKARRAAWRWRRRARASSGGCCC